MASSHNWTTTMTPQDKAFYQALGQRIAQARKAQDLTQTQLAEELGISQQTMAHYEVGRLRIAVSMLATTAKALAVSVEELMGETTSGGKAKRGPVPTLQRQIDQISLMPRTKQKLVTQMLDAVIQQQAN